jgi:formamidopyrimidine-DNA glycosylase
MPELPDIIIYIEALERRVIGQTLEQLAIRSPFLLRTALPPVLSIQNRKVISLQRIGKRIGIQFDPDYWLVLHLMIAGRLHWAEPGGKVAIHNEQAAFHFPQGRLILTEAGTKRRAALHLLQGKEAWRQLDPGGVEVESASLEEFAAVLIRENHTLKRALTDPHLVSGIGNAYSDEILHAARLSPVMLTRKLSPGQIAELLRATRETLNLWTSLLRSQTGERFPEHVTAFRAEMAVHGKFGQPCPVCGSKVQRIRYADNETNYCPTCQTGGKLLADRSLSLLLKRDWPKTAEELEGLRHRQS